MSLADSNLDDLPLDDGLDSSSDLGIAPDMAPASAPAVVPARAVFVEKPRASVYTALLALSFVALVIGSLLLAQEMKAYEWDFKAAAARNPN
jgi:hypothetical protein